MQMMKWICAFLLVLPVMVLASDYPYETNVTVTFPANQYVAFSYAYEPATTNGNAISNVFALLPSGSSVNLWSSQIQSWVNYPKNRTGWGILGSNTVTRGTAWFVRSPVTTHITFSGLVPTNETTPVYIENGVNILAYPYPADVALTNTAVFKSLTIGEKLYVWTTNGWLQYSKLRTGWQPSVSNIVLNNCRGILGISARTNRIVYESRP
ncbi:MAG: hypothetical protein FJ220_04100 [Kiritimatiellaceae bacterium]|nr:hypothetical protein [Kiritimatiellaceae bacterium]